MTDPFGIRADQDDREAIATLSDELREIGTEDAARYAAVLAQRAKAVRRLARSRQYR